MNLKDSKNSNILVSIFVDDLSSINTLEETLYSVSKQTNAVDLLVLHPELTNEQLDSLKASLDAPKLRIRKADAEGNWSEEVLETENKINYTLSQTSADTFPKIFNEVFNTSLENEYEFFSIIEPNDVIGLNWYTNANLYAVENENVSVFFPIIRNTINGVFNSLINEAAWAEGLAEEAGKLDMSLLTRFNCMTLLGAAFRVNSIKEYSEQKADGKFYPIKESIKISHCYEFLMRMVYNDVKAMCIPRVGYEFKVKSNDSFKPTWCKIPQNLAQISPEMGGVTPEEGKFWMDLAKKEYFFDEDRNKTYEAKKD